ncbi:rubrerythrin family protein [Candidatus Saccharibacteria bacterium]|nr:rubrerythrin family protein [Candidatus Saccharibacteria bacterium]
MPELKGSKTEQNLKEAFAGETQARVKYEYYASQAKKDGYEQIASIFDETSGNEKEHAKLWFKLLHGGTVSPTINNLKDAAEGEDHETSKMYPGFAEIAREEGFEEIAQLFEGVATVEANHRDRYIKLSDNIEKGVVFTSDGTAVWKCRNCGHIHIGAKAPEICPVCSHPQAFFEIRAENY